MSGASEKNRMSVKTNNRDTLPHISHIQKLLMNDHVIERG
jgi:hypothetical protein